MPHAEDRRDCSEKVSPGRQAGRLPSWPKVVRSCCRNSLIWLVAIDSNLAAVVRCYLLSVESRFDPPVFPTGVFPPAGADRIRPPSTRKRRPGTRLRWRFRARPATSPCRRSTARGMVVFCTPFPFAVRCRLLLAGVRGSRAPAIASSFASFAFRSRRPAAADWMRPRFPRGPGPGALQATFLKRSPSCPGPVPDPHPLAAAAVRRRLRPRMRVRFQKPQASRRWQDSATQQPCTISQGYRHPEENRIG